MRTFPGEDLLSADDVAFREELRDWLSDNLTAEHRAAAAITSMADDSHFEVRLDWERRLAAGRWLGATWPTEFGGRGGSLMQEFIFLLEHSRAGAPYWVGVQGWDLFGPTLLRYGSDELKRRFIPQIMSVEEFWGQGYSETESGSDLVSVRSHAELVDGQWIVNGHKIWTSFGAYANWIYALVRTEPAAPAHKSLSLLLIPVDQPGVEVRPIRHLTRRVDFCELFFTDARTDQALVVGGRGNGWAVAMGSLGIERFTTALPLQSRFPFQWALMVEELRRQGKLRDPLVRQQLARSWSEVAILDWSNARFVREILSGQDIGARSSLAKLQWSTWHRDGSARLFDLIGASGMLTGDSDAIDVFQSTMLNSRAETIYGGTNEIQKNIVGERVLGLSR